MTWHTATLGPFDLPNGKIAVRVVRPHDIDGFFLCADEHGRQLTIHYQKLEEESGQNDDK